MFRRRVDPWLSARLTRSRLENQWWRRTVRRKETSADSLQSAKEALDFETLTCRVKSLSPSPRTAGGMTLRQSSLCLESLGRILRILPGETE